MKHYAITGGIGSGKSFVCSLLKSRGIDVYDCDAAAKRLMACDEQLQDQLQQLVGKKVYLNGVLQKRVLAAYLLKSEHNKQAVDEVVHPAVAADFLRSDYQWLESAILFDSGFNRRVTFDFVVCVSAPEEVRVMRVMQRDGISREKALEWIHRQWRQERVEQLSDFVIVNDGRQDLDVQVSALLSAAGTIQ